MPEILEKPLIAPELLAEIQTISEKEKQVILHCGFRNNYMWGNLIRIWKSTYLIDKNSSHKSELLFADKIVYHPLLDGGSACEGILVYAHFFRTPERL